MEIKEILSSDFRGNVYIVQDSKVLCKSVTGFADLPNEIPNTLETRFASASAGKTFVALGILQLIEQGKLRFDDTLRELLDIDLHHIDKDVTVQQLLVHTSGVPDYFDETVMSEYQKLLFLAGYHAADSFRCKNPPLISSQRNQRRIFI